MHTVKEKVSNAASVAKEHAEIYKAQVEEKVEKAAARTKEEKEIAHERRKAKEAEAKMVMHQEKAEHVAEKLHGKQYHHQPLAGVVGQAGHHYLPHQPVGTVDPTTGTAVPSYPLGGQLPGHHNKYV